MSFGEKKRIALAGVLAMEPDILILDEPTGGLDPGGRRKVIEILRNLKLTMIIASHDIEMLIELTDRAMVMDSGKKAFEGFSKNILCDKELLEKCDLEGPAIVDVLGNDAFEHLRR